MKTAPRLSIISITLDNRSGLSKTVDSVLSQKDDEIEFLVIDGGSTDGSLELIQSQGDRIDYWISEQDEGIYHAMNKGVARANGAYLLFLNSGDWLADNVLAEIDWSSFHEDLVYFNSFHYFSEHYTHEEIPPPDLSIRHLFNRTITHQATLIRRDLFDRFGLYDQSYRICGDFEFFIRTVVGGCSVRYVDAFISWFNRDGISSTDVGRRQFERDLAVKSHLPSAVYNDYCYWRSREEDLRVLLWYKDQKRLYPLLVLGHTVINKIYRHIERVKTVRGR